MLIAQHRSRSLRHRIGRTIACLSAAASLLAAEPSAAQPNVEMHVPAAQKHAGAGYAHNRSVRTRRGFSRSVRFTPLPRGDRSHPINWDPDRKTRDFVREVGRRTALQPAPNATKVSIYRGLNWTRTLTNVTPTTSAMRSAMLSAQGAALSGGAWVLPAANAFYAGYAIGTALNHFFLRIGLPPTGAGAGTITVDQEYWKPMSRGDGLGSALRMPYDGYTWMGDINWGGSRLWQFWYASGAQPCFAQVGARITWLSTGMQPGACGQGAGDQAYGVISTAEAHSGGARLLKSDDAPLFTVMPGPGQTTAPDAFDDLLGDVLSDPGAHVPSSLPPARRIEIVDDIDSFRDCVDYLAGDPSKPKPAIGQIDPCGDVVGESLPEPDMAGDFTIDRPTPVDPGPEDSPVESYPRPGEDVSKGPNPAPSEQPAPDPALPPTPDEEVATPAVAMPDCAADGWAACSARLAELGFTKIERDTLELADAVLSKPPHAVIRTVPSPGVVHATDALVVVTTNPAEEDMPVLVPEHQLDEDAPAFSDRLTAVGLVPDTVADPPEAPEGSIVAVSPEPGSRVRRGSQVRVRVKVGADPLNAPGEDEEPTAPAVKNWDRDCEVGSGAELADPMPQLGTNADPTPPGSWYDVHQSFVANSGTTDDDGAIAPVTVHLRNGMTKPSAKVGWQGWGYRKIAAKHGWTSHDQAATAEALRYPPFEDPANPGSLTYIGPTYSSPRVSGVVCQRIVAVQLRRRGKEVGNQSLAPKHIITSYGRNITKLGPSS